MDSSNSTQPEITDDLADLNEEIKQIVDKLGNTMLKKEYIDRDGVIVVIQV